MGATSLPSGILWSPGLPSWSSCQTPTQRGFSWPYLFHHTDINFCISEVLGEIVSLLWQEEGYTVIYSLSTREIPRAKPDEFPEGSGYISPYIPTWVIIHSQFLKSILPVLSFLVRQYWKSWFSVLVWKLGLYFPVLPSSWSNMGPYRHSRELCFGSTRINTWSGEQYYPF